CAHTATRLPMVPLGTNIAAGLPSSSAQCASRALTVGSSPQTSSPTSAVAIARRIPSSGTVKVSLRRSIGLSLIVVLVSPGAAGRPGGRAGQGTPARRVADEADAVAAGPLGAIQGVVGEAQQLARVTGVVGIRDAADADRDPHRRGVDAEAQVHVADRAADLLGDQPRLLAV